ncbi:MAG: Hsp20/alpha crystallin family protein [Gammaproteobacteria bacterium]|nr:MAG: Hsp20/alpha crystallin family protein [Gammaproteobacteria bacterium]
MATLQQIREGLHEAWENLADGWQRLSRRAARAMTRFTPGARQGEDAEEQRRQIELRSSGWGLLAAEVFDDGEQIVVRLEAPGMDKDDFDLEIVDNYLVVSGEKRVEREHTEGRYHVTECAYGRFERAIPLPAEVLPEKAKATYKQGVLRVELPRNQAAAHPKTRIEIR